jgi:hypothetical protein
MGLKDEQLKDGFYKGASRQKFVAKNRISDEWLSAAG